ncbi:hypothetical protein ACHQM5_008387 [Ranunculus cassubicifolius]
MRLESHGIKKIAVIGQILDPNGKFLLSWNRIFLFIALVALFIDPLYYYVPHIGGPGCLSVHRELYITFTTLRSFTDMFYLIHIVLKFHTAYVLPGSTVIGKGELVMDSRKIASRYLKSDFIVDLTAVIPLPQVFGALWYLQSIERQYHCWSIECYRDMFNKKIPCMNTYFDCRSLNFKERRTWLNKTSVFITCDAKEGGKFKYGIYKDALASKVLSTKFLEKYLYCLWWGLNNISSFGQNLSSSGNISEAAFCMFISIVGVLLFCHLIANIQTYLQSMTTSFEVWREKTKVTDKWMKQRGLPLDLQERIHKYLQYKWSATNGVDDASIMQSLPLDLRRNVRRHVCLDLIHRVHFFSHMDNQLQDAICERLVSSLSTAGAFIIREGDPVEEILFVLRGKLESSTTGGGRYGFLNSSVLGPGDYCGEELLAWTLKPNPSQVLPSSTRTVQALTDIDAFALQAADLKYVANQFKRLHSKKLQHIFRFHSHQWRTWAASYIQAAWSRFKKRKLLEDLLRHEILEDSDTENNQDARFAKLATTLDRSTGGESSSTNEISNIGVQLGALVFSSWFRAKLIGVHRKIGFVEPEESRLEMLKLRKPRDPDFSKHIDSG